MGSSRHAASRPDDPVRFGPFTFDPATLELRRGKERVHLPFQPASVLRLLLSRGGELVGRDEIQRECWPETPFGVDPAMNAAIRQIRRALGDSAVRPRWIETLPRRGYRFVGALEPSARSGGHGGALLAAALVVALGAALWGTAAREAPPNLPLALRTELGEAEHLLARDQVDQLPRAVRRFERVLAERPDWAAAHDGLAAALFLLGERDRARAAAREALRLDPESARAHHVLGLVRMVEDWDFAAAEASLRRARALGPDEHRHAVSLAYLLLGTGRHREAGEILEAVYRADPVEPAVRSDVGWLFFLLRRYQRAVDLCGTAAELLPNAAWPEDCAQGALIGLGRVDLALSRAHAAIDRWGLAGEAPRWPASPDPRAGLEAYWAWRAERLARREPSGDSRYLLATLLARLGREREARAALEAALRERALSAVAAAADPSFDGLDARPRVASRTSRLRGAGASAR